MGLFDWLTGTKQPQDGVAPRAAADVRAALLAVNRDTAPFVVRDGSPEHVDLVAEWRIVDARWYEIFAKAGMTKAFKVMMRFNPDEHQVRTKDQQWEVTWQAGVPTLSLSAQTQKGQIKEVSWGQGFAFTEQGQYGEVYSYKFDTGEIKPPLQEAVTSSGWTWKGVVFGDL